MSPTGFDVYNHEQWASSLRPRLQVQSEILKVKVNARGFTANIHRRTQIQKRHQDVSTKNKSVTLLTNILQRLTAIFCSPTKYYKTTKGFCWGWFLTGVRNKAPLKRLVQPIRKHRGREGESSRVLQSPPESSRVHLLSEPGPLN